MVYKKYVYKRGKKHGPYYYHSYRDGNHVRKIYIGGQEEYGEWLKRNKESPEKISRTTSQHILSKTKSIWLILPILVLLIIFGFFIYQMSIAGRVSLDVQDSYVVGENITGSLRLSLKEGELLPIDSKLIISQDGKIFEYPLSEFVNANSNGSFFIENTELSGIGLGYGFAGEKETYPTVFFRLKVYNIGEKLEEIEEEILEKPTEEVENITEEKPVEEIKEDITEIPAEEVPKTAETPTTTPETTAITPTETPTQPAPETPAKETKEEKEQKTEAQAETAPENAISETSPITGQVVSEKISEIEGQVSKAKPFIYELEEGKTAEIKKESVKIEVVEENKIKYEKLDENLVTLQISDNKAEVTTDYSIKEQGFGAKFLQDEKNYLEINLQELGIQTEQGTLTIKLVYQDTELAKVSEEINVEQPEIEEIKLSLIKNISDIIIEKNSQATLLLSEYFENAESYQTAENLSLENLTVNLQQDILTIIPYIDFVGERQAKIIAFKGDERLESNLFRIIVSELGITAINETITNVTEINITALNITTKQYKAIINRPVKWIKTIKIENLTGNLILELPKQAENITIKTGEEIEQALQEIEQYEQAINETSRQSLITGQVTGDVSLEIKKRQGILTRFWNWVIKITITGKVIQEEIQEYITETEDNKLIDLIGIADKTQEQDIAVEYYTEAPTSEETNISGGKRAIISAPDVLNYTDILAYTLLDNKVSMNNTDKIKLYWVKEISGELGEVEEEEVIEENQTAEEIVEETTRIEENLEINLTDEQEQTEEINKTTNITIQPIITALAINEQILIPDALNNLTDNQLLNNNMSEQSNENELTASQSTTIKEEVNFTAYDLDQDSMIDYIEWIVPHLSNQTYEIIYITKAEHLDENRTFIEDVYDYVKEKDENWTAIPAEHYVRVTFKQNLTKDKDITIYARVKENSSVIINETEVPYELYQKKKRIEEIKRLLGE